VDLSDRLVNAGYASCLAISLGSLAPWVTAGPVAESGVEGAGFATFLLGLFAAYVLYRWSDYSQPDWLIGLAIVGALCLAVTAFFFLSPSSLLDARGVNAAWGLYASLAGSVVLLAVTGLLYRRA
jgi:hypothetical protein